jgi:DNA-directed RNA polymerase specialized sigma24 family protein
VTTAVHPNAPANFPQAWPGLQGDGHERFVAAVSEPDPAKRAAALQNSMNVLREMLEECSARRLDAVVELRGLGYSYDDLARVLNISKSRAQDLARGIPKGRG